MQSQASSGLREALGHDGVSALMTTTRASLGRARDIVDEYIAQGFNNIFLRSLSPYGFAIKTKTYAAYDTKEWLKFYFEGLRYIVELNKRGTPFIESYAAMILTKMLTPFETGYVDLMSPAGIGIAAVVYNYDGDVYASDESRMLAEMGDKTFCMGNVHEHSYERSSAPMRCSRHWKSYSRRRFPCATTAPSSPTAALIRSITTQPRGTSSGASRCRASAKRTWRSSVPSSA